MGERRRVASVKETVSADAAFDFARVTSWELRSFLTRRGLADDV